MFTNQFYGIDSLVGVAGCIEAPAKQCHALFTQARLVYFHILALATWDTRCSITERSEHYCRSARKSFTRCPKVLQVLKCFRSNSSAYVCVSAAVATYWGKWTTPVRSQYPG